MTKSEKRGCLFCGETPLTSAHLISRELQKMVPRSSMGTQQKDRWINSESGEIRQHHRDNDSSTLDIQVKRMCEPCNSRWMQSYERQINPLLSRLYHGSHEQITHETVKAIASWAVMVAFLRTTTSRGDSYLNLEDPIRFREEDRIPDGYAVWMFSGMKQTEFTSRHHRIVADGVPGWHVMVWLGQIVLVVAHKAAIPLISDRVRYWAKAGRLIHPFSGGLHWAPKSEISFEDALYVLTVENRMQKAGRDSNPR